MKKNSLITLLFCFTLLLFGCRKESDEIYAVRKIDEARALYERSLEHLGSNTLFRQFGLSVDWDKYREINDSTLIVSTRRVAQGNKDAKIIGTFELYFDLRNKKDGQGHIRYILPWKEEGRADYIAYSFQGKVIMPKRSLDQDRLAFKGSSDYYMPVIYAIKQNCPQGLYFDMNTCFCRLPIFIWGNVTPTYWIVQFEDEPFPQYFLAPLEGGPSDYEGDDAHVVAFPDYSWSGSYFFDPYYIINPNYNPETNPNTGGGGSGQPNPGGGSNNNGNNSGNFFTESEFNNMLATLSNSLTGDPIELYLIASYKNSKLLNSSTYSVGSNSITVGEYTLTPHYDSNNVLKFYTASRNTSLGIEYIVRADALTAFQSNYTLYQAAANAFYINGIPTQSQIQIAAGDFLDGLVNSWANAITDPAYYAYLTHVLYGVGVNLPAGSTTVLKPLGLGSTGRTTANNLNELLAMKEIISDPNRGFIVPNMPPLTDSRWTNWRKMQYEHIDLNGSKTVIHYNGKWENGILKAVDDFKFY